MIDRPLTSSEQRIQQRDQDKDREVEQLRESLREAFDAAFKGQRMAEETELAAKHREAFTPPEPTPVEAPELPDMEPEPDGPSPLLQQALRDAAVDFAQGQVEQQLAVNGSTIATHESDIEELQKDIEPPETTYPVPEIETPVIEAARRRLPWDLAKTADDTVEIKYQDTADTPNDLPLITYEGRFLDASSSVWDAAQPFPTDGEVTVSGTGYAMMYVKADLIKHYDDNGVVGFYTKAGASLAAATPVTTDNDTEEDWLIGYVVHTDSVISSIVPLWTGIIPLPGNG